MADFWDTLSSHVIICGSDNLKIIHMRKFLHTLYMIDIHKNCCEYSIFDNDLAVNEPPILTRSSIPGMGIGLCKKKITHTDLLV